MITTIVGTNNYARKQMINGLVNPFIKQYGDLGYESIDGENTSFDQLQSALQNLPFLSARKLIVLQKPSVNNEFVSKIDQLLSTVPDTTDVIIVESKIDKRLHYFSVLKDQTKFYELQDPIGSDLVNWLIAYVQGKQGYINPQLARTLIDRVGSNQQLLASEVDKLLLYNPQITVRNIKLLVEATPQSTIFEMLASAFAGNNQRTLELYKEQRDLKVEPAQIVAMLTWQLHILALIKTAADMTAEQIARESHQNPFVIRKSLTLAKRINQPALQRMLKDLLVLDTKLKTESIDPDEALQYYLLTLQ
jgi:DNA polymerase-3 subunit delta